MYFLEYIFLETFTYLLYQSSSQTYNHKPNSPLLSCSLEWKTQILQIKVWYLIVLFPDLCRLSYFLSHRLANGMGPDQTEPKLADLDTHCLQFGLTVRSDSCTRYFIYMQAI